MSSMRVGAGSTRASASPRALRSASLGVVSRSSTPTTAGPFRGRRGSELRPARKNRGAEAHHSAHAATLLGRAAHRVASRSVRAARTCRCRRPSPRAASSHPRKSSLRRTAAGPCRPRDRTRQDRRRAGLPGACDDPARCSTASEPQARSRFQEHTLRGLLQSPSPWDSGTVLRRRSTNSVAMPVVASPRRSAAKDEAESVGNAWHHDFTHVLRELRCRRRRRAPSSQRSLCDPSRRLSNLGSPGWSRSGLRDKSLGVPHPQLAGDKLGHQRIAKRGEGFHLRSV